MDAWCATPPPLLLPHPPCVRVAFRLPCALPCALPRNGDKRGQHQIAASGPVSCEVDQIWKRSIATSAFVVVGRAFGKFTQLHEPFNGLLVSTPLAE